jgi:hypothetical protein
MNKLGHWLRLELIEVAIGLIEELDIRFPKQIVYDAMGIVYLQY